MQRTKWTLNAGLLAVCVMVLAGCEEPAPEKVDRIRAIKPYYVSTPADGTIRRYSGTIVAANTSALGFPVAGTVKSVSVNAGDTVKKGQVLATLDQRKFLLDVRSAKAERDAKQAELNQVRQDIARKRELFKKGWIAKAALEKTTASLDVAAQGLNLARSQLGLVERDLAKTQLRAPFDGVISERSVEPFAEVKSGEKLFQLDTKGGYEVDISVSDAVISRIAVGAPVTIDAATVAGCGCTGRITEIGAQAGVANAVPVKATIINDAPGLLPGMTVEASLSLASEGGARGFLVPLVAIAPGDVSGKGFVFKFNPDKGVVHRTSVVGAGVAEGNMIAVSEGIQAGDIVAAAGVSFLRDGQSVKLLGQ